MRPSRNPSRDSESDDEPDPRKRRRTAGGRLTAPVLVLIAVGSGAVVAAGIMAVVLAGPALRDLLGGKSAEKKQAEAVPAKGKPKVVEKPAEPKETPEQIKARADALRESSRQRLATADEGCLTCTRAKAQLQEINEAKIESAVVLAELEADTREAKAQLPATVEAIKKKYRAELLENPNYKLIESEYLKFAAEFRKVLGEFPEFLATYGSRPWAKP